MAKLSADGKSVTVEKGDTLSAIASQFTKGKYTYQQLATMNHIPNADLIHPGQVIKIAEGGSSSTTKSAKATDVPVIKQFGLQSNTDNTFFATWQLDKDNIKEYQVVWYYITGNKDSKGNYIWFTGSDSTESRNISLYSPPENATGLRFKVKGVAKTLKKKVNGKETEYTPWTGKWSETKYYSFSSNPPSKPDTPNVESEGFKLTMSLDGVDDDTTTIEFQIIANHDSKSAISKKLAVKTGHVEYTYTMTAGNEYKVRCRAWRGSLHSDWSEGYSQIVSTPPAAPTEIKWIKAVSKTELQMGWDHIKNAKSYEVQYTTEKRYFGSSSSEVKSVTVEVTPTENHNHTEIRGLEPGDEYFFRVRAKNDKGDSEWSAIKSIIIGTPPSAPTTWSSTTTAIVGESLTLYWLHNSKDKSNQVYFELELIVDGESRTYEKKWNGTCGIDASGNLYTIKQYTETDENLDYTNSCVIDTTAYSAGASIQWRVRTTGITNEYGDFSIQRTVDIYAPPTLKLNIFKMVNSDDPDTDEIEYTQEPIDTVESFPFYISALAGPNTQTPIGYHLSVCANEFYETVDSIGEPKAVSEGDVVYSKYFDITDSLMVEMSAGNIDLENGIRYTVNCTASMNSGLTATDSKEFTVRWLESQIPPNAEIGVDLNTYTAVLRPYCEEVTSEYRKVTKSGTKYTVSDEVYEYMSGTEVSGAVTATGEQVYKGTNLEGESVYYCIVYSGTLAENVTLSVYRRDFDGNFTEIATGLSNTHSTYVTDPHPALDYARYRIVATNTLTGAMSYHDIPNYPIGGKSVIIQWDEEWSSFDTAGNDDPLAEPSWTGSLLTLPYNIDITDNNSPDISLIEYVGRKYPVSYYGTQLGESSTWNVTIDKTDEETIYALRRLARWPGDVYVREPSGTGYWANVKVSFSQKHLDLTIPVTLDITRVEGGI